MTNRQDILKLKDTNRLFEMCDCGHFGGESPNNVHATQFQNGHGACSDCECKQFTWTCFCDENGDELK